MDNSKGQNPCLVQSYVEVVCSEGRMYSPHFKSNAERLDSFSQHGLSFPFYPIITTLDLMLTERMLVSATVSHITLWPRAPNVRTTPSSREFFTRLTLHSLFHCP